MHIFLCNLLFNGNESGAVFHKIIDNKMMRLDLKNYLVVNRLVKTLGLRFIVIRHEP